MYKEIKEIIYQLSILLLFITNKYLLYNLNLNIKYT